MAANFDPWSQHNHQQPPKKPRHRHAPHQLAALNDLFDRDEHPPLEQRTALAEKLGMETKTVNAWFQNKRASSKKRIRNAPPSDPGHQQRNPDPVPDHQDTVRYGDHDDSLEDDPPSPPPHHSQRHHDHHHSRSASVVPPDGQAPFLSGNSDQPHLVAEHDAVPRKMRVRPSDTQIDELRKVYIQNAHPTAEQRQELAARTGMRYQSITNWFQNQRSLAKKRKEDDHDDLSPATPKPDYELRQFSAFPPPSHIHPSLPQLPSRRSPSLAPSMDDRRTISSSHHGSAPYSAPSSFPRPRRSRPEPYQLDALRDLFDRTTTPTIEERTALASEIGMEVGKVTNWFRNLRQTARKRAKRSGDSDDDDDARDPFSAAASRAGTPSPSSSSSSVKDEQMDMEVDEYDQDHDVSQPGNSDPGSEEDYQEAVTPPPPEPQQRSEAPLQRSAPTAPLPNNHSHHHHPNQPHAPNSRYSNSRIDAFDHLSYRPAASEVVDKQAASHHHQFPGIRVEDALLLLSFHQHIVQC